MRILVVQESDWMERGPHQQHHLMERLQVRGHEIRVIDYDITWRTKSRKSLIFRRSMHLAEGKAEKSSRIYVIRPGMVKAPILDYASIPFTHSAEIFRQMEEFHPDVVVGLGIANTYVAMRICRRLRLPFVYYLIDSLHTLIPERGFRIIGKILESRTIRSSDLIFVINKQLKRYAINMGAHPDKVIVLGAGIDMKRLNPTVDGSAIREKYGISEEEIVLFFMGWLYDFSGIKEVAASLMKCHGENKISLMVLGKGDLCDDLQRMKASELIDKLILVDWEPYEEVPKYIAASDICLLPAYDNNVMRHIVPIKMYEYMACGKPVIATKLPGIMKEFGEGNGVIYVDRPEDVLGKATELANDKQAMKKKGMKAVRYIQKHSWERISSEFERNLKMLVNLRNPPTS